MIETAPHPAESAPIGRPIDVFYEEAPVEQVEVLQLPTTFDQAVSKFGRDVPAHHENALDLREPDGLPKPEDGAGRSMDVVTVDTRIGRRVGAFAGAVAAAAMIAAGNPIGDKLKEAFDPAKTGNIAAEREAKTDRWTQSIVVKSMSGNDGPVKVRVNHP